MFIASYQPADVLMLVGNVAPIALYFLVLGLVNSHSRPYLTTCRSDFVALTTVLVPLLLWPVPALAGTQGWAPLSLAAFAAGLGFWKFLPRASDGFVIYNISEQTGLRLIEQALRAAGLTGEWDGRQWVSDCGRVTLHVRRFALLRNMSIHVEADESVRQSIVARVGPELERRLSLVSQLPSTMGACLVMLGAGLLILPMWMVSRHIHDLVEAVAGLF
ncbi:MAG: hypothetical protein HZA51_10915 [Planctomycetes bacterium]|nr:hypothetical protein [Planctomycetota bacterium]